MNFIDLGLPSGTKWLDSFNSKILFKTDFELLSINDFQFLCDHIPTIAQFNELKNCCKIKKYRKGNYGFFIFTGPNGNKIRLFESFFHNKFGMRLFHYWTIWDRNVKDRNSKSSRRFGFSNIPAYTLDPVFLILDSSNNRSEANYIYVNE